MNITGVSMAMSQAELGTKVGTAVLDKTMDTNEALGAGLINMIDSAAMERSVNPAIGNTMDFRI